MNEIKRFRLFAYTAYFVFGSFMVGFSAAMPSIRVELDLGYEMTGLIFSMGSWGFIAGAAVMSLLIDFFGVFWPLVLGLAILSSGAIALTVSASAITVAIAHLIMMLGASMLEAGIPIMAGEYQRRAEAVRTSKTNHKNPVGLGKLLNLIHSFFALGAIIGPLLIAGFLGMGLSWRVFFGLFVSFAVGCILVLFSLKGFQILPKPASVIPAQERRFGFARSLTFWMITVGIAMYVSSEIGTSSWTAIYSSDFLGESPERSSLLPSLFWVGLFVGRVVFSSLVDRLGPSKWLAMISIIGIPVVFFTLNPVGGWGGLAGFVVLSGLIHATMYPTMQSLIVQRIRKGIGYALAVFSAIGSVGSSLSALAIGLISGTAGVQTGYQSIFIYYVATMVILVSLFVYFWRKQRT